MKSHLFDPCDAGRRGLSPSAERSSPRRRKARPGNGTMTRAPATSVARPLRELLEGDRSLSATDARILERLLTEPRPTTARELGRAIHGNVQALYGSLDRLVERGLVQRVDAGSPARFRPAHPSVVLHELLAPWVRARELVEELEAPLQALYEAAAVTPGPASDGGSQATTSPATAATWLLDHLGPTHREVWVVGSELPWLGRIPALDARLGSRPPPSGLPEVRLLVEPPGDDVERRSHHARLLRAGVAVRYSSRFRSPAVIVDRRWMVLRSEGGSPARPGRFVRLESPELCADLASLADDEWGRAAGAPDGSGRASLRPPHK